MQRGIPVTFGMDPQKYLVSVLNSASAAFAIPLEGIRQAGRSLAGLQGVLSIATHS
jgi:hypothetical protein